MHRRARVRRGGAASARVPACLRAAVARSCPRPCRERHVPTVGAGACLPLLGTRTYTGHRRAAPQSHMSHPQGTGGFPHNVAPATATPRPCPPSGLFPAAQEAALFPRPAAFPLAAPRTGLGGTAHVRGAAAPPASHRAPRAAGTAEGVSTHPCVQTRVRAHGRAVTVAHSLHTHAADARPHARVPVPPRAALALPATFPPAKVPHALLHTPRLPLSCTRACSHRLAQARVPTFTSSCTQLYVQAHTRIPSCPDPPGTPPFTRACPRPRLTSAGAALARDGLPADPACLHLLEARHLEGVCRGGLQVLGLGGHGTSSAGTRWHGDPGTQPCPAPVSLWAGGHPPPTPPPSEETCVCPPAPHHSAAGTGPWDGGHGGGGGGGT